MSPLSVAYTIRGIHDDEEILGWTNAPNYRGTLDIIWSCGITLFLCTWTGLTINVPPLGGNRWTNFQRKFLVFLETMAGPEFILHTAMGQWNSARRSVKEFKEIGCEGWTIRHGFYADMGGFVLNTDHEKEHRDVDGNEREFPPFPLNVGQIHYLVRNKYIDYQEVLISLEEIEDKNKFDGISRLIMVCQLGWFTINIIARACQKLAVTTMELTTAGFIFCTLFMCWFWRHKPQDVLRPKHIRLSPQKNTVTGQLEPGTIRRILIEAGDAARLPYEHTPMDFATRKPHWFGICFSWGQSRIVSRVFGIHLHPRTRPIDKIWDDRFEELGLWGNLALLVLGLAFAAIHLAAWWFHFPTEIELILWRVCSLYITCAIFVAGMWLLWMFVGLPAVKRRWTSRKRTISKEEEITTTEEQLSDPKDPRVHHEHAEEIIIPHQTHCETKNKKQKFRTIEDTPPRLNALFVLFLGSVYIGARCLLFLEDIINLRSLPSSAYQTVEWSAFIPHFH